MRILSIIILLALGLPGLRSPAVTSSVAADIVDYGITSPGSGWVLTSQHLYMTRNEGGNWNAFASAGSGSAFLAADFLDNGHGWLVETRPAGGGWGSLSLMTTSDSGAHWRTLIPAFSSAQDPELPLARVTLRFSTPVDGTLRARYASSSNFERWSQWRTKDGGATWDEVGAGDAPGGANGQEQDAVYLPNGPEGWRIERGADCTQSGRARACRQSTSLAATGDAGRTWRAVPLPKGLDGVREWTVPDAGTAVASAAANGGRTTIAQGQGFDKCEVTTIDQANTWRWSSPYSAMNLYIGGSKRACRNSALSPDYLRTLYSIGWTFIPTWVGPQAPCSTLGGISTDLATAQSQGWAEAQAAADRLALLGLAEPDGRGNIAYYDMEYFSQTESCYPAAQAFVTGWAQGLHARGSLAGLYAHRFNLSHFANLALPPDAIWAADSYATGYDSLATVWDIPGLSNDIWVGHQRIRQYTRSHVEGWGGVSLEIDSNVLDAPVALMESVPDTPTPTATPTVTPTPTPTVTPTRVPFTPTHWVYLPLLMR